MSPDICLLIHPKTTAMLSTWRVMCLLARDLGMARNGRRRPIVSRVVDFVPKRLPFPSLAFVKKSSGHVILLMNQGSPDPSRLTEAAPLVPWDGMMKFTPFTDWVIAPAASEVIEMLFRGGGLGLSAMGKPSEADQTTFLNTSQSAFTCGGIASVTFVLSWKEAIKSFVGFRHDFRKGHSWETSLIFPMIDCTRLREVDPSLIVV